MDYNSNIFDILNEKIYQNKIELYKDIPVTQEEYDKYNKSLNKKEKFYKNNKLLFKGRTLAICQKTKK